jgi:NodT family efflux transporter outer membrane factor (OMF) lipoprotein
MKRVTITTLGIAIALTLAGCGTNRPKHQKPVSVPTGYGLASNKGAVDRFDLQPLEALHVNANVERAQWWTAFGQPALDQLVERVLERNSNLESVRLALSRAYLRAGIALDQRLPHLEASLNGSEQVSPRSAGASPFYTGSVGISYLADLWGTSRTRHMQAKWQADASAEDYERVRIALIGETARLYWTLCFTNQSIALGEQSLAALERTYSIAQAQFQLGEVSKLEVRQAEQRLGEQRAAQIELEQQRVEVRDALYILLDGTPWEQELEPQNLNDARTLDLQADAPASLISRRRDLRAAELRLRSSLADIDVTRSSYYPNFVLTGHAGGTSDTLKSVVRDPITTLGAGLTLPFLNWNEMRLNTEIAKTDHAIAVSEFRELLYTAFKEVDVALSAREHLAKQLSLREASLEAAKDVERLYEARYRVGEIPLRDWLDAQERRRGAELDLARTRLAQLVNEITLAQALGL